MLARLGVGCVIVAITLLGFFFFPGHTYLQSDTQIYVPMMERIWDSSVLPGDLVASRPHLSYTVYDEVTLALRRWVGLPFQAGLVAQQLVFRALQVLGVYLLATAIPLTRTLALAVAGIASLGATIVGPSVLLVEYEPVPRGFAVALVFCAIGLAARGWWEWAAVAGAVAFLYHAPTTVPFWLCFLPLAVVRRRWWAVGFLALAAGVIFAASRGQAGVVEGQHFWLRVDPEWERLLRFRALYDFVSAWWGSVAWRYVALWAVSLGAYWRLRPRGGRVFWLGLPVIGWLSVPVAWFLLERMKWALAAQIQPARALLFVSAMALLLAAAAGLRAVQAGRTFEAVGWLWAAFWIPTEQWVWALGYAVAGALLVRFVRPELVAVPILAAFLITPNPLPQLWTGDLENLIAFAQRATAKDAVFFFPNAGRRLEPGIFRAKALRSVYVDWKTGGQVNYYRSLAEDWWTRWTAVQSSPLRELGIDYVVLPPGEIRPGAAIFHNGTYAVYRLSDRGSGSGHL